MLNMAQENQGMEEKMLVDSFSEDIHPWDIVNAVSHRLPPSEQKIVSFVNEFIV